MKKEIILLRVIHSLFAVYFIVCIFSIYYSAIIMQTNIFLGIALASLALEGFLVFIVNKGDCPLIHLQKKVNDPVPFFNLFLPDYLAKRAIPFFTAVTIFGIFFLLLRVL